MGGASVNKKIWRYDLASKYEKMLKMRQEAKNIPLTSREKADKIEREEMWKNINEFFKIDF